MNRIGWAVAAAAMIGTALGLGVFTFVYAKGASYLSTDPAVCANCHVMGEHYRRAGSGRATARWPTCNDCHTPHDLVGKYVAKASQRLLALAGLHHRRLSRSAPDQAAQPRDHRGRMPRLPRGRSSRRSSPGVEARSGSAAAWAARRPRAGRKSTTGRSPAATASPASAATPTSATWCAEARPVQPEIAMTRPATRRQSRRPAGWRWILLAAVAAAVVAARRRRRCS